MNIRTIIPKVVFAGTIFASAFSLFLVQPLIAKQILPWFGGTAAVWAICMVFFQVVLLGGYAYSDWLSCHVAPRRQVIFHVLLLATSLLFLPIIAKTHWKPTGADDPTLLILGLLLATIGLPYFLLSTTGPLIQSWVARTGLGTHVYRYFSLSNIASLIALISYPFLIETRTTLLGQAYGWSVVYAGFAVLCAASGIYFLRHVQPLRSGPCESGNRISDISASMGDGSRRPTGAESNEKTETQPHRCLQGQSGDSRSQGR